MDGKEFYLREEYNEALKLLRSDVPFERTLIESIEFTRDINNISPQIFLLDRAVTMRNKKFVEFLKMSWNDFVKSLSSLIAEIWKTSNRVDLHSFLEKLDDHERGITLCYVGYTYAWINGDYDRGMKYLNDSLDLFRKVGDEYWVALANYIKGICLRAKGLYSKALDTIEQSLRTFEKFNDLVRIGLIKLYESEIYSRKLGEIEKSEQLCDEAKAIFQSINWPLGVSLVEHRLGLIKMVTREYDRALEHFRKALVGFEIYEHIHGIAHTLLSMALVHIETEEYDRALGILENNIFEKAGTHLWTDAKIHKAVAYLKLGKRDIAKIVFDEALLDAKNIGDFEDVILAVSYLTELTKDKGLIETLVWYLMRWRKHLKFPISKDVLSQFTILMQVIDCLIDMDKSQAYSTHLLVKNGSVIDVLPLEDLKGDAEVVDFHFGERTGYFYGKKFREVKFKDLRGFVEGLLGREDVRNVLCEFYNYIQNKMGKKVWRAEGVDVSGNWIYLHYHYKNNRGRIYLAKMTRKTDLLRLLNDILHACLVHYSHLVAVTGMIGRRILTLEEWKSMRYLSKRYNELAKEILIYFGESLRDLFNYDRVIISPQEPLNTFPFHLILYDNKTLIESVEVVKYIPHSDLARMLKEKGQEIGKKALLIYSPDAPEAEEEVKVIRKILPECKIINAAHYEKDELLKLISKEKPNILHFACHAEAMPKGQYSYLSVGELMTINNKTVRKEKYRIYLDDLLTLKLKLDLVCLPACESGRFEEALDALGLPLAFFAQDAKAVIATLWRVYGDAAKNFSKIFYKGCDYEAYKKAVRYVRKKFNKLYFWGSFVYYGI